MKKVFTYIVYLFAIIGFVLVSGYFAIRFGITNEQGVIDMQRNTFLNTAQKDADKNTATSVKQHVFTTTSEWKVLKEAIYKDREAIFKASALFSVKPRLIVAILIVEQLRLYNDNREVFKTVFAPLRILGIQSQYSWGVMGIKQETAIETEHNLLIPTSLFYPGKQYEHLLDFTTDNPEEERYNRLTEKHDRFYSYLYTAAIIKELLAQWNKSGYDISTKPDVVATLFNIGFAHSKPNPSPKSGGATITLASSTYSFGSLAKDFYYSNELIEIFPR